MKRLKNAVLTRGSACFQRARPAVLGKRLKKAVLELSLQVHGSVFVEYLLLLTIVGIGVIVGLATVRSALINELNDLAAAINAINS